MSLSYHLVHYGLLASLHLGSAEIHFCFVLFDTNIMLFYPKHKLQIMAAKLKACQEIMPPPHQHQQQQQQRRKPYMSSAVQKSLSPSLKSLNSTLNASRLSVSNDLDESLPNDQSPRKTTAI